jgi:hypothetical protein
MAKDFLIRPSSSSLIRPSSSSISFSTLSPSHPETQGRLKDIVRNIRLGADVFSLFHEHNDLVMSPNLRYETVGSLCLIMPCPTPPFLDICVAHSRTSSPSQTASIRTPTTYYYQVTFELFQRKMTPSTPTPRRSTRAPKPKLIFEATSQISRVRKITRSSKPRLVRQNASSGDLDAQISRIPTPTSPLLSKPAIPVTQRMTKRMMRTVTGPCPPPPKNPHPKKKN